MPSLEETLAQHNIPFRRHGEHHHVTLGWVGVDCTKCSPGWGKFRLGFEIATGRTRCWICGIQDGVAILSEMCGITLREAATILRKNPSTYQQRTDHSGRLKLPNAGELLPPHRGYLQDRGFDPDEIARTWGVKGIGLSSKLGWRILIPIADKLGRVVSWTTRSIGKENSMRYISASEDEEAVSHKDLLYGAHLAKHSIVIVEGPIDAWAIGPGGVLTFGLAYSQSQLSAMIDYPVRVVCFDAEDTAQERLEALCRELSVFPGSTENIVLETGKDAAECNREEIADIRAKFL